MASIRLGGRQRPHLLEVTDLRPRPELVEQAVGARTREQPRDPALRIAEVAERDGLRGAGLLARGAHVAVAEPLPTLQREVLAKLDPLHAERALLHHPARAHGDVWV